MASIGTFWDMVDVFSDDYSACSCWILKQGFTNGLFKYWKFHNQTGKNCPGNPNYIFFFRLRYEWMLTISKLSKTSYGKMVSKWTIYYGAYHMEHMIYIDHFMVLFICRRCESLNNESLVYRGPKRRIKSHKVNWKQRQSETDSANQMHDPTFHQL